MIKAELVSGVTLDKFSEELNSTLRWITKENGDGAVISVSHAHPVERFTKFSALITYKAKA